MAADNLVKTIRAEARALYRKPDLALLLKAEALAEASLHVGGVAIADSGCNRGGDRNVHVAARPRNCVADG